MTYEEQLAEIPEELKPIVTAWLLGATVYRYEVDPKSEQLIIGSKLMLTHFRALTHAQKDALPLARRFRQYEKAAEEITFADRDVELSYSLRGDLAQWTLGTPVY